MAESYLIYVDRADGGTQDIEITHPGALKTMRISNAAPNGEIGDDMEETEEFFRMLVDECTDEDPEILEEVRELKYLVNSIVRVLNGDQPKDHDEERYSVSDIEINEDGTVDLNDWR